jgi:phytoene desaturase
MRAVKYGAGGSFLAINFPCERLNGSTTFANTRTSSTPLTLTMNTSHHSSKKPSEKPSERFRATTTAKTVAVVGGGIGALSGAIRLARMGFRVTIFEKNASVGGKLSHRVLTHENESVHDEYRFGVGPSLLTMPFVFDELLDPICRYFYPDGSVLNTSSDKASMMRELTRFSSEREADRYEEFLAYSKKIYDLTSEIFLLTPFQEARKILQWRHIPTLLQFPHIDPFRTLDASVRRFFKDERLIQLFDRYATYNGSNPFQAPATLNIIPWVEYGLGGFYIRGGMFRLVEALRDLAESLGVQICTNVLVENILHDGKRVSGVRVAGENIGADYVLCNADVVDAHNTLIAGFPARQRSLNRLEPSVSGMVFLWGINKRFEELAHHNIIFSADYQREFAEIFKQKIAPRQPTIYVSISSKNDPHHAPAGHENWFVLLNMPYVNGQDWRTERERMKTATLQGLQAIGIDVAPHIVAEDVVTPQDIQNLYHSNKGSIYGLSSNTRSAAFLRPANRSRDLRGLYFCSGSAHPGGGIPLVALSGKMAAELIADDAA